MAASFCHPIASPICFFSVRQVSILAGASSSGGGCPRQGHSIRTSLASGARLRVCLPCTLLGPAAEARKRRSVHCGAVRTIGESEFAGEVLGSKIPVLVDFVADWCGPCRLISPIVEWASQEYSERLKIFKIDHDSNPKLIEEYRVYGLPTLILFRDGKEVPESRREGVITKVKLREYLDSLLGSTTAV